MAGDARKELEQESGTKVISETNFLEQPTAVSVERPILEHDDE